MDRQHIHAVTGAFGYSGKYIAQKLLNKGFKIITLTNSLHKENPFGDQVTAYPFQFDDPDKLTETLKGVDILYNTYWVRFNHKTFTHSEAVKNSIILFEAAKNAGVKRVVHISITNPSEDSSLEYFSGKAKLEQYLKETGLSYSILRPAVLFGKEDILINNIAWALRKFPVFGVFGDGMYRLQPVYVDDLADIAVEQGKNTENLVINCIGPETFTYRGLVEKIGQIIGKNRPIISISPETGYSVGSIIGTLFNDVFITRDEIKGLMDNLLCVDTPPVGKTKLTDWAGIHADSLGRHYASELARRMDK